MEKYLKKILDKKKIPIYVVLALGIGIGLHSILVSHAAAPYGSVQTTSGSLSGQATKVPISGSTSGEGVQFGISSAGVKPPSSIPSNCSSDATSALNAWFASLPANSTVSFPTNGCYQVSNSPSLFLTIQSTSGLTINGNGTTLDQASYNASGDPAQPVLALFQDNNITVNNLTIKGPSSNGGDANEGDAGIQLEQDCDDVSAIKEEPNCSVMLNDITVTSVEGDGLDLYPYNGNDPGVNWNVTVDNSTLENIGYHAIVPEAADGFTFENSTITSGNIDAEVDFSCDPINNPDGLVLSDCGSFANPTVGVVNMIYKNDTFPNGLQILDGMSCMPVGNWTIDGNNFAAQGMELEFNTTYSLSADVLAPCGQQSGLTVENNTSTNTLQSAPAGSGSPYFILQGWKNVTVTGNHLVYNPAQILIGQPFVDLCGDSNVAITNNVFGNLYNITNTDVNGGSSCGGVPSSTPWPATTDITNCGNSTGPATDLTVEPACPG